MKRFQLPTPTRPLVLTHAERVIDATSGITKGEMAAHYAAVADLLLPFLRERPVALVKAPQGITGALIFQKHSEPNALPDIELLSRELDPGHPPMLEIRSATGLQSIAQMNVIELHTWNSTVRSIRKPDRIVFDLDPGEGVSWETVREGAFRLHEFLTELGLRCFLKTSGGKGLHVVVPLMPSRSWEFVKSFAKAIVVRMTERSPDRFVSISGPSHRVGRIFIDYLRNGWGATTAVAWSARARPGLGVSVPIGWHELDQISGGAHWTVRNLAERLAVGNRSWEAYSSSRQGLASAIKVLGFESPAADAADHPSKETV